MPVSAVHHYTIRCMPKDLDELRDFYTKIVGLTVGERPDFAVPGYWLYSRGEALVHLFAYVDEPTGAHAGPLDHIAFRAHDLARTRSHLAANGITFEEAPVPGYPLHQIFFHDPNGLKLEFNFLLDQEDLRQ